MTDINPLAPPSGLGHERRGPATARDEHALFELVELLFFAYRDFVSDPDEILATYGFGRAHHRVIHFVARHPGMRVARLLDILRITKQSLGRVLKQLIQDEFVYQKTGHNDRRERRLYLTDKGTDLARALAQPQLQRIDRALRAMGPEAERYYREILYNLINPAERDFVTLLTQKRHGVTDRQVDKS
jgi:DNA-binding MarR family transcriptional regulator